MKAKIEDGKVTEFYIGIEGEKNLIEVPEHVSASPENYDFTDGKFVEKKSKDNINEKSLEQRVEALEKQFAVIASMQVKAEAIGESSEIS